MVEEVKDGEVSKQAAIVFVEADVDEPRVALLHSDPVVLGHVVVLAAVLHPEVEAVRHREGKGHLQRLPLLVQPNAEHRLIFFEDCPCNCIKLAETAVLPFILRQNLLNLPRLALQVVHHLLLLALLGKVVLRPQQAQFLAQQLHIQLLLW